MIPLIKSGNSIKFFKDSLRNRKLLKGYSLYVKKQVKANVSMNIRNDKILRKKLNCIEKNTAKEVW